MKHAIANGFAFLLLGSSLFAQVGDPILVTTPLRQIRRMFPNGFGDGAGVTAVRVLSFDPDGDMLHDLAILWSSGELTFAYAPEVMSAFVDCPVPSPTPTGIARIPAAAALPNTSGCDGLLVSNGVALQYMTFDPDLARNSPATGFTLAPVTASAAWQHVVKVEVFMVGTTCWVLGLEANTIHVGVWSANGIVDSGTASAGASVQQMLVVEVHPGLLQVVARTQAGLEMWDVLGQAACLPIPAPTSGAIGALTSLHDGPVQKLAWVVQSSNHFLLRVFTGTALQQETVISDTNYMPDRFRPISIGAMALDTSGTDALVLDQNSTAWQLVLTKNSNGDYKPSCAFQFPGITYPSDTCPAILDDINNDAAADCTTVLANPRCVQIETGLPIAVKHTLLQEPIVNDGPDMLPVNCFMSQSAGPNGRSDDTIGLRLQVPSQYAPAMNLQAQVVAWPQYVAFPDGGNDGFGAGLMGAGYNLLFPLAGSNGVLITPRPILPTWLLSDYPLFDGNWNRQHEYYFLVRLIKLDGSTVAWSSPAQMVGFVANSGLDLPQTQFMDSISSTGGYGFDSATGGNRNTGIIRKPMQIDPPNNTVKVPDPGQANPGTTGGEWNYQ